MFRQGNDIMTITNLPDFWQRVREADHLFLGLDYDGTLAPFDIDPMAATPVEGVKESIRLLGESEQTRVAIISGRPLTEVMTLLGDPRVMVIGSHGHELWPVDGAPVVRQPSPNQAFGLEEVKADLLQRGLVDRLECKVASLAVHTRGLPPELALDIEEVVGTTWAEAARRYDLECRRFNGGVEIRCAGWGKGAALTQLLDVQPDQTLAVYIGDDETDEDAFTVLRGRGVGIKVGDSSWPTAAQGFLPDCHAVADFLQTWISLTDTARRSAS